MPTIFRVTCRCLHDATRGTDLVRSIVHARMPLFSSASIRSDCRVLLLCLPFAPPNSAQTNCSLFIVVSLPFPSPPPPPPSPSTSSPSLSLSGYISLVLSVLSLFLRFLLCFVRHLPSPDCPPSILRLIFFSLAPIFHVESHPRSFLRTNSLTISYICKIC